MARVGSECQATAYGRIDCPELGAALEALEIACVPWDLHVPLEGKSIGVRQHDVVFFLEVIEHVCRWPVELLSDVASLVSPGGYLIVTTVNLLRLSNRYRVLRGRSPFINPFVRTPEGRNHVREYSMDELRDYVSRAGLELEAAEFWALHYVEPPLPVRIVEQIVPSCRNYMAVVARKPACAPCVPPATELGQPWLNQ